MVNKQVFVSSEENDDFGRVQNIIDNEVGASQSQRGSGVDDSNRVSLKRHLRLDVNGTDEEFAPLPRGLMRKYIAYAMAYCHPKLTPPAAKVLQAYYLELRAR